MPACLKKLILIIQGVNSILSLQKATITKLLLKEKTRVFTVKRKIANIKQFGKFRHNNNVKNQLIKLIKSKSLSLNSVIFI